MPNKNYIRGAATERRCMEDLEKEGYLAFRSAGSHGIIDVIAIDLNCVRLIQLKRTKKFISGYGRYQSDKNYVAFKNMLCPHNCRKEIWVWVDKKGWKKLNINDSD